MAGQAQAEPRVIAMLGDSLTQGFGLPVEQGLVPQLETWLKARGADVRLINAGVSGDTTAGGAARVDWTLTPEVDGVVVALGGNDMLRGIDPGLARENLKSILTVAQVKGVATLLVGFPAPGNYGSDYKASFDSAYTSLAVEFNTLFIHDFLSAIQTVDGPILEYLQDDRLHPNPKGVAKLVERLGPSVLELVDQIKSQS